MRISTVPEVPEYHPHLLPRWADCELGRPSNTESNTGGTGTKYIGTMRGNVGECEEISNERVR